MKQKHTLLLIAIIVSLTIGLLAIFNNLKIATNYQELIEIISKELQLEQNDETEIIYAGKYIEQDAVLVWFIIQNKTSAYYRAMECQLLSNARYLVKKIYYPMIYSDDIVHILWKSNDIFLINDPNCKTIEYQNQLGEVLSQVNIPPDKYPYIFCLTSPAKDSKCSFLDSLGNQIC